ncbi:hypothetical protein VOLCADRAFT_81666 [Volvox carteri f. nagariensis]|uniref:Leucine carboxyl methyltransferase 1 homolog n=1 Tax=Volvox carteri f. nagariensis TaxID=3068 RepID=D8TZU8_VOLCA|nr:uncharacterized protein VOLCADRAFT_81666 [Volvox carteri f. nagariensis]EFJ47079.1 hypothetical protein VOLCADRAFT_81666 [Volvox carteri f. nagariensis]|eukprot:XP_002951974.1 hypothetical protein VOLCADRAFT_81666 [Volvox carteri f. nagariensis]
MLRSLEGSDASVQGTNDDAQISKMSCAKAGYFKDEFIQYFVRRASRRSPLINRGYYSRHAALRQLLNRFLAAAAATASQQPQVLVLGAGFDTTWFQLHRDLGRAPYKCLEVDFKEVTQRKAATIAKEPALRNALTTTTMATTAAAPAAAADAAAGAAAAARPCPSVTPHPHPPHTFRRSPTYILSECVLVYMEPLHSAAVVSWAAHTFPNAVIAIYEQIRPDDAFGRQMVSNLEMRGCPLRGLPATPSLAAHCARLMDGGWAWADARDMDTLYRTFLESQDKARVERLEIFDELEEWHMIQEHYCIALGRNDVSGWLGSVGFD